MANNFEMNIKKLNQPNTLLCELGGSIELQSTLELESIVEQVLENGRERLIFDLQRVHYINSRGLSALLALQRQLNKTGGGVMVIGAAHRVGYAINLTGFDQAVNVYDDLDQALIRDELFS